jgi:hypothetical protein
MCGSVRALESSTSRVASTVRSGWAESRSATTPVRCGVAIDVPEIVL